MPHQDIRIGTLAGKGARTPAYIQSLLPHGFESFQINFWKEIPAEVKMKKLAAEVRAVLDAHAQETGEQAIVSSLGMFGNPLENKKTAREFQTCIDACHLFGPSCNMVCGFAGCLEGKPIPDAMPTYVKVFKPLAARAADKGLKIAFENCPMGGTWSAARFNIATNPAAWELMFDALPADNVGLEWEPCHQMTQFIDPIPQLRQWLPKIFHLHGKDATIHHDLVSTYGIISGKTLVHHRTPGFGDTNWTDVISILRMAKWQGSIDIEGWHDPVYKGELEMTGQVHGLNYLKHCRGGAFVPNPEGC